MGGCSVIYRCAANRDGGTRNQIRERTKILTYELIRRSDAWSQAVAEKFPLAVRLSMRELRAMTRETPLLLFRGYKIRDREHFLDLASEREDRSDLLHWDFGPVMELKVTPEIPNYLFSNEKVPYHWDGVFFKVPSFLVFHCLRAPEPGCGGETLFADTARTWDEAPPPERERRRKISLTYESEKKPTTAAS